MHYLVNMTMNNQSNLLLPDKSFWMALDREQRNTLVSRYTILCPSILFTEVTRHGKKMYDALLNLENIVWIPLWWEHAKMDLLTEESARPLPLGSANAMKSLRECSEQELLEFKEVSSENIEMLKEIEDIFRNLDSIINPSKERLLGLVDNTDNLSEREWVNRLKEILRENQMYNPEIERNLKKVETEGFPQKAKELFQTSIKTLFDTYKTDSLENANRVAASLLNHDSSDCHAAHDRLQRICKLFDSILTQEERTQIFNRFLKEDMPPIIRFAPYALRTAMWNCTIQLYLRENSENAAPKNVLRDAEYLHYTYHKGVTFVSADKWHRKFIDEVPLFKPLCRNFIFVDLTTKATIKEGFSKLL